MKRMNTSVGLIACATFVAGLVACAPLAAEDAPVIPWAQDRPPGPALSPDEAIAKMTVPEGFQVELVASEPDIVNPVAMTFDERGRIWITESLEYPRLSAGPGRDRIKILEDTDGDGRAEKVTIFAEGLNIPSGIAVGHGGVWVANAPDILLLKDTDGDDRADEREVIVTGFGRKDTHELPNSLSFGPDGWLYGLNGVFNESLVQQDGRDHRFTAAIWRVHPVTREFELFAEGTSNPWGIAFDSEGSMFLSACVIDHLWHIVEGGYYHRQAGAYPSHTWKIESIVDHLHQKAAYCGIEYFDSDAYPPEYRGRLYMGNIHGGAINVDRLERNGATYTGLACPDFLQANDAWFMPVAQKTGPDGCLYVLDWYDRYHCYQDARRDAEGIDRLKGRLYRIRYGETPRAGPFDLAAESDEQLIERLASANVYFRQTAQRLLAERDAPDTSQRLEGIVLDSTMDRKARLAALWTLVGRGSLTPALHLQLTKHPDATFRAWAVRAAGNMRHVDKRIATRVAEMAGDPAADVQLQVAIAARKIDRIDAGRVLFDVLSSCGNDELIPRIVWRRMQQLLDERSGELVALLERQDASPGMVALLPRLVDRLSAEKSYDHKHLIGMLRLLVERGAGGQQAAAAAIDVLARKVQNGEIAGARIERLRDDLSAPITAALNRGASDALHGAALVLAASWNDSAAIEAAHEVLTTRAIPGDTNEDLQVAALRALVAVEDERLIDIALRLLAESESSLESRREVLAVLGRLPDDRVASGVLKQYTEFDAQLKPQAIELLTQRAAWSKALLQEIGRGEIPTSAIDGNHARKMLASRDSELAELVSTHWGTLRKDRDPAREQVVEQMSQMLSSTAGNAAAGGKVFNKLCAECHKIYGRGEEVGPDLTSNGRDSFAQLLSNVFDPSLVIGAGYRAYTVVTEDGRVLSGLLIESGDGRIVLKTQGGKIETIPRSDIDIIERSGKSLMPEGVENQLTAQEIADLFAYLLAERPAGETADPAIGKSGNGSP